MPPNQLPPLTNSAAGPFDGFPPRFQGVSEAGAAQPRRRGRPDGGRGGMGGGHVLRAAQVQDGPRRRALQLWPVQVSSALVQGNVGN